jgi:tRNA nucleotidyltransferase (CCA-adding enzyme)
MSNVRLEQQATIIIETLIAHQYEAYWVGGYVRDRLLGRDTQDIDIATSAKPEQVMALFDRCKPTGVQHGTVLVIVDDIPFEVTTFRYESEYDNYRRPAEVQFIQDIQGDLGRRDFTINAMAIDRSGTIIDPYGGQDDLRNRILRCVGDAHSRFGEDALRMMRCIRFAAEYDLIIEPSTWDAVLKQAPLLTHIAMERIRIELERIVNGNHCGRGLHLFVQSGLFRHFKLPVHLNLEQLIQIDQSELTNWLSQVTDPHSRLAVLFIKLGISSDRALTSLRTLTFANQQFTLISGLLSFHEWILSAFENRSPSFELAVTLKLATLKFGMKIASQWLDMILRTDEWINMNSPYPLEWSQIASHGEQWLRELPVVSVQDLHISGSDIVKVGYQRGPRIGQVLQILLEETALQFIANDKDQLILRAEKLVNEELCSNE